MFKVGIGPSSSHTVGPMKAAHMFVSAMVAQNTLSRVATIQINLYGSLAATGNGHGTGPAVLLGLEGQRPESVDPEFVRPRFKEIIESGELLLNSQHSIVYQNDHHLTYHRLKSLPYHANGMTLETFDAQGKTVYDKTYYSVGGGFVIDETAVGADRIVEDTTMLPYAFSTGKELLAICEKHDFLISDVMLANEQVWRSEAEIRQGILSIWNVMQECVSAGIHHQGILPGGLKVKRRAFELHRELTNRTKVDLITPSLAAMDWVNLYALAVNEENAAGGRMVTAPTNGAAGIIPAVLHYYKNFCPNSNEEGVVRFLLVAAAVGILFKENASISGAEVGCQGEVGSACAMAAAGLTEVMGGSPSQVENAAEIAMEHNLGLTCDPIGGLVQIPCIERNAMAAMKAINASSMALRGSGEHFVSLDKVIRTMRDTGQDMLDKYKETSRGGLAVNVIEC